MRSKLAITMAFALVLTVAVGPFTGASQGVSSSEANEEQTGQTAVCAPLVDDVAENPSVMQLRRDGPGSVEVEAGTAYDVSVEEGTHYRVTVEFYDDGGNHIPNVPGEVPAGATWAKVCAWTLVEFWEASTPLSEFTYQDGFAVSS